MKKIFYTLVMTAFLTGCGNDNFSFAGGDLFGLLADKTEQPADSNSTH